MEKSNETRKQWYTRPTRVVPLALLGTGLLIASPVIALGIASAYTIGYASVKTTRYVFAHPKSSAVGALALGIIAYSAQQEECRPLAESRAVITATLQHLNDKKVADLERMVRLEGERRERAEKAAIHIAREKELLLLRDARSQGEYAQNTRGTLEQTIARQEPPTPGTTTDTLIAPNTASSATLSSATLSSATLASATPPSATTSSEETQAQAIVEKPTQESAASIKERRAASSSSSRAYKHYFIRPGDTLLEIAQTYTGDPAHYRAIAALNGIADSSQITIGQPLRLPTAMCVITAGLHDEIPFLRPVVMPNDMAISDKYKDPSPIIALNCRLGISCDDKPRSSKGVRIVYLP